MKTQTPRNRTTRTQPNAPAVGITDDMPDPLAVVEHLTIAGFIRRCPHRFHIDEITRFGNKVGNVAEALQVSYLTTIDRSLGMVRLFPVPLMQRVYEVMAAQFGWEVCGDAPALEDKKAKLAERMRRALTGAGGTDDPGILAAFQTVMAWLEGNPPPPTPQVVK